ncbi:MAG: hypoxanthine phosphoribosyltransferase [Clostridia bacterium]|nr:hypoxanthine phosphoribosyltransferase [Clostridia bacterium]
MQQLHPDVERILADEKQIDEITTRLAKTITKDYQNSGRDLVFVVILKGSIFFATDLIRKVPLDCNIEFMKVSSYGAGTTTSGFIQVHVDLKRDVKDADVILVEDIIDSGRTLEKLSHLLANRGAHSVKCCTLLDKPERRQVPLKADYTGMEIPDEFVVGYGLDYNERYRNLPYVGILKRSVYASE